MRKLSKTIKLQIFPCHERIPRHFIIDKSGILMLVANQETNTITAFRIKHNRRLIHLNDIDCDKPQVLKIVDNLN
jgi:6-phosphogluconolactonase (cycloisomerase 2 family)